MSASNTELRAPDTAVDAPPRPVGGARAFRVAALATAAVLVVFFAPAVLGGGEFVYRDTGRLHAPVKKWIGEELARGRFPQWNPYSGLGTPVIATAQDAVMHPFSLLLAALPPGAAIKAWVLLSFALAAAGAFAWVRVLGGSAAACVVGALAFALSGPLVSSSDNVTFLTSYAALPWVFAATHLYVRRGGPAALLGVACAAALCAAAGDPQAWGIALGLVPIYAATFADRGARAPALRKGLAAAAAGVVASAPFVLPLVLWLPYSQRTGALSARELARWNLSPVRLIELAIPDLLRGDPADPFSPAFQAFSRDAESGIPWFLSVYLGIGVLALAALALSVERRARVLWTGAIVFLWVSLGIHGGFGQVAARLPVLRGFRYWEKAMVWVALLVAIAAARGVDVLLAGTGARRVARAAAAAAAVVLPVAAAAALFPDAMTRVTHAPAAAAHAFAANVASGAGRAGLVLALLAVIAAAIARGRLARAAPLALVGVLALDLFGGNAGAYVVGPPEPRTPPPLVKDLPPGARVLSPFREREDRWPELGRLGSTFEWLRRTLAASWNVPLGVGSNDDYVGLRSGRWARIAGEVPTASQARSFGPYGFGFLVVPGNPDFAAKAGVATPARIFASDPELPAWLVEVPHRPRAYVAGAVRSVSADEALRLASSGGEEGTTVVEGPVPATYAPPRGDARIVRDEPGSTLVETRADGPALLVLADLHAPGWAVTVDGRPAEMVRANAVVRGVWVAEGTHEIAFRYRTPGLLAGWAIALAGALALGGWALLRRRRAVG